MAKLISKCRLKFEDLQYSICIFNTFYFYTTITATSTDSFAGKPNNNAFNQQLYARHEVLKKRKKIPWGEKVQTILTTIRDPKEYSTTNIKPIPNKLDSRCW